mmetsp:Transcript_16446/g.49087  ORF Transcript_16446/g.49087 Transcript_16446/m.49087 type:complete len:312 (-) Transcript_16446:617-1552(-)
MDSNGLNSHMFLSLRNRIQAPVSYLGVYLSRSSPAPTQSPRSANQMKVPKKNKAKRINSIVITMAGEALMSTFRRRSLTSLSWPKSASNALVNLKTRVTRARNNIRKADISWNSFSVIDFSAQYGTTDSKSKRNVKENTKLHNRPAYVTVVGPASSCPTIMRIRSRGFSSSRRACPTVNSRKSVSTVNIHTHMLSIISIDGGSSGTQELISVSVQPGGTTRMLSTVPRIQHNIDNNTATKIRHETSCDEKLLFSAMSIMKCRRSNGESSTVKAAYTHSRDHSTLLPGSKSTLGSGSTSSSCRSSETSSSIF